MRCPTTVFSSLFSAHYPVKTTEQGEYNEMVPDCDKKCLSCHRTEIGEQVWNWI
jgi:hypothetical protein